MDKTDGLSKAADLIWEVTTHYVYCWVIATSKLSTPQWNTCWCIWRKQTIPTVCSYTWMEIRVKSVIRKWRKTDKDIKRFEESDYFSSAYKQFLYYEISVILATVTFK